MANKYPSSAQQAQNALKLSAWLAVHEPTLFRQILVTTQKLQRSPLGRFGLFGDDSALDTITVSSGDVSPVDFSSVDLSSVSPDVTLQSVGVDAANISVSDDTNAAIQSAVASPPSVDSSVADASQSSGGFWSSIGSGISSVAGAVGKVAGALVSPQALQAAGNAATAYFNAQAKTAQSQAQAAAVQTQLSRVNQGAAPAPITYVRNPVTGALTPVYQSNAGAQPLTASLLSQLNAPGGLLNSSTLFIGGAIALVVIIALAASR